jgi:hypothetical protein
VQVAPVSPGAGNPTGTVTFLLDGTPIGTAAVDPATGEASIGTASIGLGWQSITASYSGDSNFDSSQSSSSQLVISAASTQTVFTAQAIRNKRGKIVGVELEASVLVVSPGSGDPTGTVTYLRKGHVVRTIPLSHGIAVLTLKPNKVLKKSFTVHYGGDGTFLASTSSPLVVTQKSLVMSAQPLTALFTRR